MGYIISTFTGFSSSQREVTFCDFVTLIFSLFLSIKFARKVLLRTTLVFYSMIGTNNTQLFVIISIDTFLVKENCYKAVTNSQKKNVLTCFC